MIKFDINNTEILTNFLNATTKPNAKFIHCRRKFIETLSPEQLKIFHELEKHYKTFEQQLRDEAVEVVFKTIEDCLKSDS